MKKKIFILATGGTIAGIAQSPLDFFGYTAGSAKIEDILAKLPEIKDLADLAWEDFCQIASENADPKTWLAIARRAQQLLDSDAIDGLVITSGTDTLEEMAYFLNLLLKTAKPVVITGAMRPLSAYGTDGPVNLYNAVSVAASKQSAGKGVLAVLNDTILAARGLCKQDSYRLHTFGANEFGSLGYVAAGEVHFMAEPRPKHTLATELYIADIKELPAVEIFYMYGGANAALLRNLVAQNTKGLIVAGFGNGTFSDQVAGQLTSLMGQGIVCAVASRTRGGFAVSHLAGLLTAADLSAQQARILLLLGLACGKSKAEIKDYFWSY